MSKWLAIEIITFYAFIGTAILFLILAPYFAKRPLLEKSKLKDLVDFYYDSIQSIATFVSVFAVAGSLLYIDRDSVSCDDSYTPLIWWILIFFMWPTLIPYIRNPKIRYAAIAIIAGVVIYVPIKYGLTDGCPREYGMKYFILSAMITVVIGSVMNYL